MTEQGNEVGGSIRAWCMTCRQNVDATAVEVRRGVVVQATCGSCGAATGEENRRTQPAKDIGDIIDLYCSRCRLNLDGSVAALVDGLVVKATCRTCQNEVKYRPPVDERVRKQKALERLMRSREKRHKGLDVSEMKGPSVLRELWDQLTDRIDARYSRQYLPTGSYEVEEAIRHKAFGLGIVHEVHEDGTLHVLFRDGFRGLPSRQESEVAGD